MGDGRDGFSASRLVPPQPEAPKPSGGGGGWWVLGLIVVGIFAIGRCSSGGGGGVSNGPADANSVQAVIGNAIAAAPATPELPLSRKAVALGRSHLRLASVEDLPGEMIYSQNCYDGLARRFSWDRLDTCGAFDQAAVVGLGDADPAGEGKETAWFEGEAAAGRYLKAATAAGEDADEADQRLGNLQAFIPPRSETRRGETDRSIVGESASGPGNANASDDSGSVGNGGS